MRKLLLACCLSFFFIGVCPHPLRAEESLQEIRVHLATSTPLQVAYIGKIHAQEPAFSSSYLSQLEAILNYDFNYNGSTKVLAKTPDKELLLSNKDFSNPLWKRGGISYVIRSTLEGKSLRSIVFNTQNGSVKTFPDVPLSGDLGEDRKYIHKVADAIYKALFNKEGVASTHLLFAYQVKNPRPDGSEWISEIWECDWDGANARQITHENSYCVTPVCLPQNRSFNNDKFLYVSYKLGQPKILLGSLKGGVGKRLIDLKGNQLLPTIAKQRDKIAFISNAGGRTDLFIQPLNPETGNVGKPVQLYSYPRSTQASPTFSPDGSKIAFASDKDGGVRIYVISSTPSETRPNAVMISKQNKENSCPSWSPDGTKLAYSAKTGSNRQIWIYDFATQEEMQLTSGPGHKENPVWGPDSNHIVFNSTDNSNSELYIVNLNQPEAIKISRGPGKKHYPTWGH